MIIQPMQFISGDKKDILFFSTLRQRIDLYFKDNKISKNYNAQMVLKTIILLSSYILPFAALLIFQPPFAIAIIIWVIMGLAKSGIGMSIMHDANHGAYSPKAKINKWLGFTINLVGGVAYTWKLQHNIMHHTYTNIVHMDDDIEDKAIMRFSPHTKVLKVQKFQFIYAFLFYGILTLYWSFMKDFVQFHKYTKSGVSKEKRSKNKLILANIILCKIFYIFAFFVLPLAILKMPVLPYVIGYLSMQFISGILLAVIFQLAHTVEQASHPIPNETGNIENNWAIHQMNTTVNFSQENKLITWYVGGLNFQVEHHLFPNICHVHYPKIAGIVRSTATEFGIPYLENKTLWKALKSHVRTLQRFGKMPSLNETIS